MALKFKAKTKEEIPTELQSLYVERDGLNAKLTATQVDQGVVTVATKKGLRLSAIPDITGRARTVFKLAQGVHPDGVMAKR